MKRPSRKVGVPVWLAGFAALAGFCGPAAPSPVAAAEEETAKDIVAIQIRRQGYPCDRPRSAEPDPEQSRPDEAVWVLRCENAAYRVRLIPDEAAKIEVLD